MLPCIGKGVFDIQFDIQNGGIFGGGKARGDTKIWAGLEPRCRAGHLRNWGNAGAREGLASCRLAKPAGAVDVEIADLGFKRLERMIPPPRIVAELSR